MVYLVFGNKSVVFFIPMVIFIITILISIFKPITLNVNVIKNNKLKNFIFCDGHIGKILILDILVGWIVAFILSIIEHFNNYGFGFVGIFLLFFVAQFIHYINLITTNKKIILSCFCLLFSIPIVYIMPLGFICALPLAF